MIAQDTVLVQLIRLIDRIPAPSPPKRRPRGRPIVYSDRLFLKALVIMRVSPKAQKGESCASGRCWAETKFRYYWRR